ncbi:fas-activated serine/threonine kinase isoform X2 [Salminus brasiliensis]
MLRLSSRLDLLTCGRFTLPPQPSCLLASGALASMYATRLYGGGGGKPGRRMGLMGGGQPMLENPHHSLPPHHHPHIPPPQSYPPLYHGRLDAHRPHYQTHQQYQAHPQPPHLPPPHYQPHSKKTWNFIHEKMSYDTFFTMKRLIDRSHSVDEVLRWVTQNPGKISHNHYPIALQKIGQLLVLHQAGGVGASGGESGRSVNSGPVGEGALPSPPAGGSSDGATRQILDHPDFQTLCDAIVNDCSKFDNFSIVNCLYAVAALGLPSDSQIVQVLEEESQGRLSQFNQKDISMVFSSSMKLHPSSQHPLIESCLAGLEKNIERERHPQTLFLLLSYYRTKWRALQTGDSTSAEQLVVSRKILRLVKHTLSSVSCVRDHEMALLDEMLAACACEVSNKSLEIIFSSHLLYQNRQEKFISSLAEELPKKIDSITPYSMALIAKYIARHRIRETRLMDTIAEFLVKKGEYLDSKVIQKLVFPFSRMNYRPPNEAQFFSKLEMVLELKALSSPLATVNILMSLFQLEHFPSLVLHRVFSPSFISNVTNSPYTLIVRRYLSLLDAAVELEHREYTGPRLQDSQKVLMFEHALTADEVNRKYSYKGLVGEALRQLVGENCYKQNEVLAPGYCTDFLLWIHHAGCILPIRAGSVAVSLRVDSTPCAVVNPKSQDGSNSVTALTSDFQKFSPFSPGLEEEADKQPDEDSAFLTPHMRSPAHTGHRVGTNGAVPLSYNTYYTTSDYYSTLAKEHSLESQDSSTLSSPSDCLTQAGSAMPGTTAPQDSLFQFSIGKILEDEGGSSIPAGANPGPDCEITPFYEGVTYEGGESNVVAAAPLQLHSTDPPETERSGENIKRVIMSVNDKWHYCHNSDVLVGSRNMRDRHLRLLGYIIVQLPYLELEKLNGIEEVKQYLHKKLLEVPL